MLESAIKSRLEDYSALTQTLATTTSIWAVLAPDDAAKPFITYEVVTDSPTIAMSADCVPSESLVIINIFADTFLEIANTFSQLRTCLDRYTGAEGGVTVQATFYEGRNDNFDLTDRDYQRTCNFRIFYEDT